MLFCSVLTSDYTSFKGRKCNIVHTKVEQCLPLSLSLLFPLPLLFCILNVSVSIRLLAFPLLIGERPALSTPSCAPDSTSRNQKETLGLTFVLLMKEE